MKPSIRARHRNPYSAFMAGILVLIILLTFVSALLSAYYVLRPVDAGAINQVYLWADETMIGGVLFDHKGVDFPTVTGTEVRAATSGTVVALDEHLPDNDHSTPWGNYVVVRHNESHWDKDNGAGGGLSYVYSMYLHLQQNQVLFNVNDSVVAGEVVARSDNTGNSSGPHLHYQVVLHPSKDINTIEGLDSRDRSRNPELWIEPLSGRATAVGIITNDNGVPIENLRVCGLRKAGQVVPIRTYSFDWANPDDLLGENFGTTDVSPGTYHLYAYEYALNTPCGQTQLYRDLGSYTFTANRTTYIGLYPSWLPALKYSPSSVWDIQTYVRSLAPRTRSAINVSYLFGKKVMQQWVMTANSFSTTLVDGETDHSFSGLIVPSQDAAALELLTVFLAFFPNSWYS